MRLILNCLYMRQSLETSLSLLHLHLFSINELSFKLELIELLMHQIITSTLIPLIKIIFILLIDFLHSFTERAFSQDSFLVLEVHLRRVDFVPFSMRIVYTRLIKRAFITRATFQCS
jgi:hypothetical protein